LPRSTRVVLISPDEPTRAAIGPNVFDPTRRGAAAAAGRVQGRAAAAGIQELWGQKGYHGDE